MSSKYSNDFKLKVLEYYFEHGGEKKFGNKARTANHFCIDHKTVSRMLCNPEMVKKARKLGKKNSGTESTKSSKPNIKNGQPYVSIEKIVGPSSQKNQNTSPSSSKPSQSSKKYSHQSISEVPVIELPEDPDFSVLKSSIDSSISSVPHVARLLITGNAEVKYIIANECDLIFECKVCRNLFRSVINFLAHKRNYCQEKYTNVRNLYHKDTPSNMTTESSTVFVEPEPPSSPVEGESSPLDFPEALKDTARDKSSTSKIDKIATQLVKRKEKSELASSSTNKGSSEFFKSIEDVNNARKSVGTDCTVVLKDIKDVSVAVYQSMVSKPEDSPPARKTNHQRKRERPMHLDSKGKVVVENKQAEISSSPSASPMKEAATVIKEEVEVDNEEMEVDVSCNSCNSIFSSKKMLNAHIEEAHGLERMVYTCPICNVIFLSIWGCVKHLVRVHKKKKHQRDRLKHVICSRAYKKVFTPKEIAKHSHKSCSQISKAHDSKLDESITIETSSQLGVPSTPLKENVKEIEKQDSPDKAKESSNSRVPIPGTEEESPGFFRNKALVLPNTCPRCLKSLPSPTAMGSHLQVCSLTPMSGSSETPEKKIAIQIRKDYKKDSSAVMSPTLKESGSISNVLVTVKEEPHESASNKIDDNLQRKRIQERINELCLLDSLTCIPCNKKYNTINILKRHVSTHFGWTRFSCTECPFRHYERYVCLEHCTSAHKYKDKAEKLVMKDDRFDESEDKKIRKFAAGDNISRKVDSLQNGGYTSSECSVSIISEDSVSIKSEFDSQETEKADVAYRELIEKTDDEALTEVNNGIEIKSETPESNTATLIGNNNNNNNNNNDHNDNAEEKKLEADLKSERPQRNRKTIEQKDFVYEPLRSPTVSSRSDENKIEGSSTLVLPRQQRIASGQTVILKIDRSSTKRKEFPTPSVGEVANKKTCARVLTDINPHFSICNGQGGNTTVIARTVMPGSFDKSQKPTSVDISSKKEPVGNRLVNSQSPTKLNCSTEQTVTRNKDQLPMERKIQLTGLKLKEIPDHRGNGDDSIAQIGGRNKTLANVAKESLVDETKKPIVKKTEEKTESAVKDSSEKVANENTLSVKKDSISKLTDVEQLISRLKKRLDQNKFDNLPKKEVSSPKPEEHQDRDLKTNQKITVVEPLNKSKSISVIQIQTQNSERKRTSVLTPPTNTLVVTSTVTIPSSPSTSSSLSSPSTSRPEAKIKIKVETKQEKDAKRDQTVKSDRLARKKSLDSKNS